MGAYTTEIIDTKDAAKLIKTLKEGYTYNGIRHRANFQVAMILSLQANLGCRIGDIVHLTMEDMIFDGDTWRLDMTEEKTGKARRFVIPTPVKDMIDSWTRSKNITSGRLFTVEEPAVWKQLRAVTGYLGLKNTSAHSFRKAAALRVYKDSGEDIALTSQYLNHANTATTLIYLRRTSKQMDELLSKSVVTF